MRRQFRSLGGWLALAAFASVACGESGSLDGALDAAPDTDADTDADADSDTDADADSGPDSGAACVAECGACGSAGDTDVSPCCGEMVCVGWVGASDEAHCQPDFFSDSDLCASFSGAEQGAACTPLGLECVVPNSDSDSGETEWYCSCEGWQDMIWD
jgi:hypothetical protein